MKIQLTLLAMLCQRLVVGGQTPTTAMLKASLNTDLLRKTGNGLTVTDTIISSVAVTTADFHSRWKQYEMLMNDKYAADSVKEYHDFMEAEENTDVSTIYKMETSIALAMPYDSTGSGNDSTAIANRIINLADAATFNSQLSDDIDAVHYHKLVNGYYIESLDTAFTGFDSSALEILQSIANLCPTLYGAAIYDARTLLKLSGDETDYDDISNCSSSLRMANKEDDGQPHYDLDAINKSYNDWAISQKQLAANNSSFMCWVSPNPAGNQFVFEYSGSLPKGGTVAIYNRLGIQTGSYTLKGDEQKLTIDASKYGNGSYVYKVLDESGKWLCSGKITVIH